MKMNKKGFTLAELLIVIAIIAILIGIAIPAFSASLDSAKLQTDHANIRSAYAMFMTADMLGELELPDGVDLEEKTYYFQKDGTLAEDTTTNAYKTQVKGDKDKCISSVGCMKLFPTDGHAADMYFGVKVEGTAAPYKFTWVMTKTPS